MNENMEKIHYCWFGGGELPDEYKKYIESWRKCCPDYEIIRWDESNYDVTKNRYMRQAYENKKWAFVSDYARVDIIYHQGGIYLDTDVELVKNFDEFLKWDLFCGFESFDYVAWGVGFGAVKEHEILKDVLNEYEKRSFLKEDGSFDRISMTVDEIAESFNAGRSEYRAEQAAKEAPAIEPETEAPAETAWTPTRQSVGSNG